MYLALCFCAKTISAAEYHCRTRYACSHLLAFPAPEHAWRCSCLEGAGDMKTLTCSPAYVSLLHFCQLNYGNGAEEVSFLLPPLPPYTQLLREPALKVGDSYSGTSLLSLEKDSNYFASEKMRLLWHYMTSFKLPLVLLCEEGMEKY